MLELHKQPQVDVNRQGQDEAYGERLFEAGQFIDYCTNLDQRRGWRRALNNFGFAEGNAYLVAQGRVR